MAANTTTALGPLFQLDRPRTPAQEYTKRLPSPPRVNVPPPLLDVHGLPDLTITQGSVDFDSSGFANAAWLKWVTHGNTITHNSMLDWKYEQRHQAQQILPFLFLGPVTAARDSSFLQRTGITMVLAVRNSLSAQARLLQSKVAISLGISSETVDVAGNQELIAAFPAAIDMINTHLAEMYRLALERNAQVQGGSSPGKVLVFCESGNERSAALVTAYIMAMYSMDMVKALQLVQAERFAVSIDDSTRNLLENFSHILQAKRDIAKQQSSHHAFHSHQKPGKRTLDDTYGDTDIEMGETNGIDDAERFEQRNGVAPFQNGGL